MTLKVPSFLVALLMAALAFVGMAIAQNRITAEQVAEAVRNSPNASQWLRDNADAVGRLAMFESGGRLDVYNGSCCYGILQMNNANIADRGYTPAQFQQLPLQDQVNAWAHIMSNALRTGNPRQLAALDTFDGRAVTGDLVLACVQLGIGNCGRMIRSGSCSGFADRNGTTICAMADKINGGSTGTPVQPGGSNTGAGGIPNGSSILGPSKPMPNIGGSELGFHPANYEGSFESGSGQNIEEMKATIQMILVSIAALVIGFAMFNSWLGYSRGQMAMAYFKRNMLLNGAVFMLIIFIGTYL